MTQNHSGASRNFRDFGGSVSRDGRRVRLGRLYRSEALDSLTEHDLIALNPLSVTMVCDLRSQLERDEHPNRLPADWRAKVLQPDEQYQAKAADLVRAFDRVMAAEAAQARDHMRRTYESFPEDFAAILGELFVFLTEQDGPLLIHCAAGKDRTGFVCAMLNHALEVNPETTWADYMLSDEHFGQQRIATILAARMSAPPSAELIDYLRVRPEYLQASFDRIEAEHGSIDTYLESRAGLTSQRRRVLHSRLFEPR